MEYAFDHFFFSLLPPAPRWLPRSDTIDRCAALRFTSSPPSLLPPALILVHLFLLVALGRSRLDAFLRSFEGGSLFAPLASEARLVQFRGVAMAVSALAPNCSPLLFPSHPRRLSLFLRSCSLPQTNRSQLSIFK